MKVLIIGSGGREHAIAWKLAKSRHTPSLFSTPGNPGIAACATCVEIGVNDMEGLVRFVRREDIDLTIVGPEQPLAEGIVNRFRDESHAIFGPTREAAELEWRKSFAKDFMTRHGIPTASYKTFTRRQVDSARDFAASIPGRVVVKADGLAAGKGVTICASGTEGSQVAADMLTGTTLGRSAESVVIEEFMDGEEASVFAICDGNDYVLLATAQDHKQVNDGDAGKNTGGMGAYAPAPVVTTSVLRDVSRTIVEPTLKGMSSEGRPYSGCLYVGLMITEDGAKVVEYNSRFGDPETQAILPLFKGDLLDLVIAANSGKLGAYKEQHGSPIALGASVCVVLASEGYPDSYPTGIPIQGLETFRGRDDVVVFHAGTRYNDANLVTAGGRVLGVTSILPNGSIADAIDAAYAAVSAISFQGMHYRRDIGRKALRHAQ